jgi:hypothetical protein
MTATNTSGLPVWFARRPSKADRDQPRVCTSLGVADVAHLIAAGRPLRPWQRVTQIRVSEEVAEAFIAAGMARRSPPGG